MAELPPHGMVRRYKLELAAKKVCAKCRAANSRARAIERANRKARDQRANLSIVPEPQTAPTDEPTPPPPSLAVGGIENAVRNLLNTAPSTDLLTHVYGEIVIVLARAI